MANENLAEDSTQVKLIDRLIHRPAGTLDSLARDIRALERRVASLEEDRNRRDELDANAAAILQSMRD